MRRFANHVRPDSYLLRADWRGGEAEGVTLYCRFPREPRDDEFVMALARAGPLCWGGPPPSVLAAALGVPGPRGVGVRVDRAGRCQVAAYFRIPASVAALSAQTVDAVVGACGLPGTLAPEIRRDVHALYVGGTVGVVGVGPGPAGPAMTLKLNPPNVPVGRAFTFLNARGAPAARLEAIASVVRSLRAELVNYLGVRYDACGFAGWRVYLSVAPGSFPIAGGVRLAVEHSGIPTRRLPHY